METSSDPPPPDASPQEAIRHKLRTEAGRAVYKMRKAIVEPVFGQIKEQRGFRRFSLRGKQNVSREWKLVCATSNLLKLFPGRMGLGNGIKRREKRAFYPQLHRRFAISYQRDYRLRPPDRTSAL